MASQKMQIPIIRGDKVSSSVEYRDALPVNMVAVPHAIKGARGYMSQWYGLTEYAEGDGVDRGARWVTAAGFEGQYRVSGTSFIKVNSDGTITNIGTVPDGGQVSIAFSFNNVAIVAGGELWYYNPTDGLRQIVSDIIGSPIDIVYADGLFVLTDGTDLYHSTALDEESFLAADFGNAQFRPDLTNGLGLNEDNEIIAFGVTSTEYFQNSGLENFAYTRIQLKALKLGILGTHCRKEMNSKWYVIGRREETSPAIHVVQGGGEDKISTREIDQILFEYTQSELSTSTVDAFVRDGLKLVQFNLPNHTLLFNETAAEQFGIIGAWSIIKSDIEGDAPFRGINYCLDNTLSKWVCGDRNDSKIGILDGSVATQYGEMVEWLLFTPFIRATELTISRFEVEIISGFSEDSDATVFLSSTMQGIYWGNEITTDYGSHYEYDHRFIVRPQDFVRDYIAYRMRGVTRSRMTFAMLTVEVS